jgi:hypothetical protein
MNPFSRFTDFVTVGRYRISVLLVYIIANIVLSLNL